MTYFKPGLVLAMAVAISACAGDKTIGSSPNIQVTDLTSLPRPSSGTVISSGTSSRNCR